jgi:hypothetical protein
MELLGESRQEVAPGQAAVIPSGAAALVAPSRTPPPAADPAGTSLRMPRRELDSAHPGPDEHQITRARPDNEAADPDATMAELEQEYQDRESELWSRSPIWKTGSSRMRRASMSFPQPTPGCVRHCTTRRQESKLKSMRSNDCLVLLYGIRQP